MPMKTVSQLALTLCVLILCGFSGAVEFNNRQDTLAWFEAARFGIFVHWDPRSNVVEGSFDPDIRPQTKGAQQSAMFDKINKNTYKWQTWNPVNFNANEWIDLFVASGAKYFTFTTVHSRGFCNFDSPVTDFDIMSTEYKKDIVEQLAHAAEGRITPMWYFGSNGGQEGVHIPKELWPQYYKSLWRGVTTYDQLRAENIRHLITNTERYGNVAGIWWDGGGKWNMKDSANKNFFEPLFEAQPWLIMSPRCSHPKHNTDWRCTEQRLGGFKMDPQWEMCIPIESSVWFWAGGKKANTKDLAHCVKLLVMCAGGDGNLLLNISPMPNGRIQPLQADILRGMGQWLKRYGESIYGTRGGPYKPEIWGGATRKGNKIYLHILQELKGGQLTLPALPARVIGQRMLTGGSVTVEQDGRHLHVALDRTARSNSIDRIVELQLEEDVLKIEPIETGGSKSLTLNSTVTASSEYSYLRPSGKTVHDSASNVVDNEDGKGGHWTAQPEDEQPWIAVDLERPLIFQQIYLVEKHTRICRFEVQYYSDRINQWQTLHCGNRMNYCCVRLAEPIKAQKVRVSVLKTDGGPPQISRFDLFK
jgi:alpha-L-fucosidase